MIMTIMMMMMLINRTIVICCLIYIYLKKVACRLGDPTVESDWGLVEVSYCAFVIAMTKSSISTLVFDM